MDRLPYEIIDMIKGFAEPETFSCIEYVDPVDPGEYKEIILAFPVDDIKIFTEIIDKRIGYPWSRVNQRPRRMPREKRVSGLIPCRKIVWIDNKPFIAEEIIGWPVVKSRAEFETWLNNVFPCPPTQPKRLNLRS